MTKVLGLFLWVGSFLGALLCFSVLMSENVLEMGYLVAIEILLLASGIGRRIFGIKKNVIKNRGLLKAILSRIHCLRFYLSIFWYAALMFAFVLFLYTGDAGEGYIMFGISCLPCIAIYFFLRRTCPRCGVRLSWDGDADDGVRETRIDKYGAKTTQGMTEYYHCPRCGRKVSISKKRTVAQTSW